MQSASKTAITGTVFDVQSFSVHDGPGCRTTVFLKGCNLQCRWCANPESWRSEPELLFASGKCRYQGGCRRCLTACEKQAIQVRGGEIALDWQLCRTCTTRSCAAACCHEALRSCGREYGVEALLGLLNRDREFWGSGGGVTFSGGEPLCQAEFVTACLKRCRQAYMHTAIETAASVKQDVFLAVMAWVDFAFIDLKHMDPEQHRIGVGVDNALALANIAALKQSAWPGRLVLRLPVIPGFNADRRNIVQTADFMQALGLFEINLLPFHRLGDSKWTQLGRQYPYADQPGVVEAELEEMQEYFIDRGIACYVGSETPF